MIISHFKDYVLPFGIVLATIIPGFTQPVNIGIPPMRNFSKKEYKAGTQSWDAAQDSRGVMYWANNDGLLKFDGTNWICLPVANHTIVRSVTIDTADRIFVGAQSEFGYFSPAGNGHLVYQSLMHLIPAEYKSFEDVWDIILLGNEVFFRTNHIVFQYANGQIKAFPQESEIHSMFLLPAGLIIQQDSFRLSLFQNGSFQTYTTIPDLRSAITGAHRWQGDTMILSSLKQGLYFINGTQSGHWKTAYDGLLSTNRIYSSTLLPDGNLALGTSLAGLIVMDHQRRVFRHLTKKMGLQNNNILNTFCDRTGNVWLGLDNGIDCVILDSPFSNLFPDGEMQATGYGAAVYDHKLYLGVSNGAYVSTWQPYYDPEEGPFFKKISSSDGQVWSIKEIGGELLMGHHEGSFLLENQNAKRLSAEPGAWTFVQVAPDYMLGGTYNGLILYRSYNGHWIFDKKLEGLEESCRIMVKDENGSVWVSHPYRGLYHIKWSQEHIYDLDITFYNQENGLPTNLNNYVFEIAGKAVFTTEKGVFHFDYTSNRFIPADDFNRLLGTNNRVRYLREDAAGNVWFVTEKETGILMVDDFGLKKEVAKKVFPELAEKLVGGFEFLYPIDERNVIIGSEQGFIHYSPKKTNDADTLLQIILSNITASGVGDSLLFGGYASNDDWQSQESIQALQAAMNNLSFSYSATDYKNPGLIEYRVQLEGLDEAWSNWSSESKKNYTNLGPGKYTFHVQARIRDSYESKDLTYTFRIRPPWYKSKPALAIYSLGFISFFAGFIMRQRHKFETEKAQMTETHQQKEAAHLKAVEQSKAALSEIQNEKLEAEITYKNQELALTTMHLVQKAEILLTIQEGLNQILEKSQNPIERKEVQQLLNLLNFDVKLDEDWEHFAYHFDQVHVNFLKHLRERFPQLSANDCKLSAYLRMNLSTKEIAPLMNISVRGVEGSRYRLRRKLNLPNDANLTEFILGLAPNTMPSRDNSQLN